MPARRIAAVVGRAPSDPPSFDTIPPHAPSASPAMSPRRSLVVASCARRADRARDGPRSPSTAAHPEIAALPGVCALVGELVPLKVVTRGVEGEVTTSTTFAFALLMLAGGPRRRASPSSARASSPTRCAARRRTSSLSTPPSTRSRHRRRAACWTCSRDVPRLPTRFHFTPDDLPGILAAACVFFVVNTRSSRRSSRSRRTYGFGRYLAPGLLLPGLDRRPAARPLADASPSPPTSRCRRWRCCSCRCSPSTAAAARRSPRSTRRCTTRSPACRTACCSATASSRRCTPAGAPTIASP